jgi:hypothetical protein
LRESTGHWLVRVDRIQEDQACATPFELVRMGGRRSAQNTWDWNGADGLGGLLGVSWTAAQNGEAGGLEAIPGPIAFEIQHDGDNPVAQELGASTERQGFAVGRDGVVECARGAKDDPSAERTRKALSVYSNTQLLGEL